MGQNAKRNTIHVWNTGQLSTDTDSIPALPPPMPSLSQLVHQMRRSGHPKRTFDQALNSIVEPPSFEPTHEDFDESSVYMMGVTSSTPISEGGFYANLFPEVPICLLPSSIQLEQPLKPPAKPPATSAKAPATSAKLPATSSKPPATSTKPVMPPSRKNEEAKKMMFMRRQNKLKECQDISPVDADGYQSKNPASKEQPWPPDLGLSKCDQRTLLSPTAWLTDDIINVAQKLLKAQSPALSGFQNVGCGLTMNFSVETEEFVQIIHTGEGHWVTISTIGTSTS